MLYGDNAGKCTHNVLMVKLPVSVHLQDIMSELKPLAKLGKEIVRLH